MPRSTPSLSSSAQGRPWSLPSSPISCCPTAHAPSTAPDRLATFAHHRNGCPRSRILDLGKHEPNPAVSALTLKQKWVGSHKPILAPRLVPSANPAASLLPFPYVSLHAPLAERRSPPQSLCTVPCSRSIRRPRANRCRSTARPARRNSLQPESRPHPHPGRHLARCQAPCLA